MEWLAMVGILILAVLVVFAIAMPIAYLLSWTVDKLEARKESKKPEVAEVSRAIKRSDLHYMEHEKWLDDFKWAVARAEQSKRNK